VTLTIGRFSTPDEASVDQSGNSVTFGFHLRPTVASDDDHFHALVQQVLGLVDNEDEEVVPVTWSQDATFDGFYRVTSVSVPNSPIRIRDGIVLNCSITLERLRGYATAEQEETVISVLRTNGHGWAGGTNSYKVGVPAASTSSLLRGVGVTAGSYIDNVPSATGAIDLFIAQDDGTTDNATITFSCPPASQYAGAAMIEAKYGSTWYPVVGRNLPSSGTFANVRVSNGLIRATFSSTSLISMEVWNGSAWEAASETFQVVAVAGTLAFKPQDPWSILRNGPDMVSIGARAVVTGDKYAGTLSISLIRGSLVLDVTPSWATGAPDTWRLEATTNTACTSNTGGLYRTSNDANGNRWVLLGAPALTKDAVNGKITLSSSAVSASFGIGMELNGSGSSANYAVAVLTEGWFVAHGLRQRVIVR
jgi:hypothetical protein